MVVNFYYFYLNGDFYILIKYSAKNTLITLIISIANILSLWHGISFIGLLQGVITYCEQYVKNTRIINIFNKFNRHILISFNITYILKVCILKLIINKKLNIF